MKKALQDFYTTFTFKDNARTKYYFDIVSVRSDGNSEIEYPVVSIRQNRRDATGAETFKNAVEQIEQTKSAIAVIIREYNGYADDCTPVSENRVEIKNLPNRNENNGKKKQKPKQNYQPQQMMQVPMWGLGSLEQTNQYLNGVNSQLQMFGIGGIQEVLKSTASNLTLQEKYDDAKQVIQELKLDNKQQLAAINQLKEELSKERDKYKHLEYKLMDVQREAKMEKDSLESKLMWTSVIGKSLGGAFLDKMGISDKIGSLLGVQQPQGQPQQQSQQADASQAASGNSETDGKVQEIIKYLNSLDKTGIENIYAICEFVSTSADRMNGVLNYIESKK